MNSTYITKSTFGIIAWTCTNTCVHCETIILILFITIVILCAAISLTYVIWILGFTIEITVTRRDANICSCRRTYYIVVINSENIALLNAFTIFNEIITLIYTSIISAYILVWFTCCTLFIIIRNTVANATTITRSVSLERIVSTYTRITISIIIATIIHFQAHVTNLEITTRAWARCCSFAWDI